MKNFSLRPVLVFAVILLLFGCYVTQIHCLCNHHRVDRALRLMFSHYFVVIALNLVTVSFKFLENPEASRLFTAELMRTAVILFFIAIYSDSIYYHSRFRFERKEILMLEDKKCIDFHAHPVTDAFRKAMADLGIDPMEEDGFPLPKWSAEEHLAFMDEAEIDYAILSAPVPHIYNGNAKKARKAARQINEETENIVRGYSDRFGFAGLVPLPDVEGALDETAYALDVLGAAGLKVSTNMGGIYLGDPLFDPVMEEWNRRKSLVIIHPCGARKRPENVITGTVAAIYEYPADTTRAVLNMIANRIMTRFPDIRWVVPHCGSFLPYMLQRFTGVSGILASLGRMETVDAGAEFEKLYFDIAGDPEPVQLNMLRMVTADDRLVYGSDFPHSPAKAVIAKKKHFDENPDYDGIREKIYCENAVKLLRREEV